MAYRIVDQSSGLPPDYEIRGDNRLFFSRDYEIIVSGPAETGKTLSGLLKCHIAASKYPGAQIAVIRRVYNDLIGTVLRTYKRDVIGEDKPGSSSLPITPYGGERPTWYDYANGSRIWLSGFDRPGASLSGERDIVYVAQAEELSLSDWEYLIRVTTGRGAIMPYTQLLGDCNPSSRNHWILKRARDGHLKLGYTSRKDNPALWDGHAWTRRGRMTMERLGSLTGVRRARLFDGVWANPEGAIYESFDGIDIDGNYGRHVCRSFDPPQHWARIVGVDPYGEAIAAVWLALDPHQAKWHVYREYAEPFGMTRQGHAHNIMSLSDGETIFFFCGGGPSENQDRVDYTGFGLPLLAPGVTSVWAGIDKVHTLFRENGLVVHDACAGLISELGEYRRKMDRHGNVLENEIHNKGAFHLLDALRYAIIGPDPRLIKIAPQFDNSYRCVANLGY
jgi:hypothetical protein